MRLIYEKLVQDYLESLHSKLRNFGVEPEFLGMWVHDEDDNKSLFEIFLAAQDAGLKDLTVAVGPETVQKLDQKRLTAELGDLGEPDFSKKAGALEVHVVFKSRPSSATQKPQTRTLPKTASRAAQKPASLKTKKTVSYSRNGRPSASKRATSLPGQIHPIYQAALSEAGAHILYEGDIPKPEKDHNAVSVEQGGARLSAIMDSEAIVRQARHKGANGPLRALLDQLCGLMIGRPIQEAQDHGVIRLEAKLRDRTQSPPVSGLLTAHNAEPLFDIPQKMVRSLYREYLARSGRKPEANFWDDTAGPAWASLSAEEKLQRAQASVQEACRNLGISPDGIEVLDILGGIRFVLALSPATADIHFGARMMRLESLIKKALDPRIELQLESVEDRNKRAARTDRSHKLT